MYGHYKRLDFCSGLQNHNEQLQATPKSIMEKFPATSGTATYYYTNGNIALPLQEPFPEVFGYCRDRKCIESHGRGESAFAGGVYAINHVV